MLITSRKWQFFKRYVQVLNKHEKRGGGETLQTNNIKNQKR